MKRPKPEFRVKPNYELKSKILKENQDILKLRSHIRYLQYKGEDTTDNPLYCSLCESWFKTDSVTRREVDRIQSNLYHIRVNVKNRIEQMIYSCVPCYFITLTFNDKVLYDYKPSTRRQKVFRTLKSLGVDYVANIDYGDTTEREHYHAVICSNLENFRSELKKLWTYGFCDVKKVRVQDSSSAAIARYITKLTSHAIKSTNKRCCIIYSRKRVDASF